MLPHKSQLSRRGLTILELLVVFAVIAVLVALILPAVQAARESARRVECSNHLKQIGIALHSYHELLGALPPGWRDDHLMHSAYAWSNGLLPFLEQNAVFNEINFSKPLDAPEHLVMAERRVPALRCPSDIAPPLFALYEHNDPSNFLMDLPHSNYVGVFGTLDPDGTSDPGNGPFVRNRSVRFIEFVNGQSNVLMIGERTAEQLPATWFGFIYGSEEAQSRVAGYVNHAPGHHDADECEFSSRHTGGAFFLWGDGRASFVSETVDQELYREWGTLKRNH